jgi:poly(A) polymerase
MRAPPTCRVFAALEAAGGPDCARFVGGCVRNAVLGQPVDDIDIATTLIPDAVVAALKAARIRAVPTGVEHGTITAVADHHPFEITTLRRDVETDGRRAVVAFTTDWAEDAERRDFRLNALYAAPDGRVFDPTGSGLKDAREGRIVFVGDPRVRIREDYLRILRFFRFHAWYGRTEADPDALAACAELKAMLEGRPGERIHKELLKLLAAPEPRRAAQLMSDAGVLQMILPETVGPEALGRLVELEQTHLRETDPELRLAALLPHDPERVAAAAGRLRLSNAQRDRLVAAAAPEPALGPDMTAPEARRTIYRLGGQAFRDRAKLAWAGQGDDGRWPGLIGIADSWTAPTLPLSGEEVMALGAPRGPKVGQALKAVEDWWVAADFPDDRRAIQAQAKAAVERLGA